MITISNTPKPIAWIGNRNKFGLTCSGITTPGAKASYKIKLLDGFPVGGIVTITYESHELTFTKTSAASANAYEWKDMAELMDKIGENFYLGDLVECSLPATTETNIFLIEGKAVGTIRLEFSVSDGAEDYFALVSGTSGYPEQALTNYHVRARIEVQGKGNTPWMNYHQVSGNVTIGTEILRGFFGEPDLPELDETYGVTALTAEPIRYRLKYCEVYGSNPLPQAASTTGYLKMMNGELVQAMADIDHADWVDENPSAAISPNGSSILRVIGEDSGTTEEIIREQPKYIYLVNNNTAESSTSTHTLKGEITKYDKNGNRTVEELTPLSITNGVVYRMAIGTKALGISSDYVAYHIDLLNENGTVAWHRTYQIVRGYYNEHVMLLMDRYGLMKTWLAQYEARKVETTADEAEIEGKRKYINRDTTETFTATSAMMSRDDARLLVDGFSGEYAYMYADAGWRRIHIVPGSVEAYNEENDMVQVAMDFVFEANQKRNKTDLAFSPFNPGELEDSMLTEEGVVLTTEDEEAFEQ